MNDESMPKGFPDLSSNFVLWYLLYEDDNDGRQWKVKEESFLIKTQTHQVCCK